jgi:transposase
VSNAVYETLPHAIVIVDRFLMAKNYRACADKARKAAMHALNKTLSDQDSAELKGAMWVFRKRWQELTLAEQIILLTLFRHAPALKDVYIFRAALSSIFNSPLHKTQAVDRLTAWIAQVQAKVLIYFNPFIKTLQKWITEITHYFSHRQSSGFVEGLNNKIKVIKRRCYGIYNLGHLFQHIWLDVEGRRFGYA